MQYLPGDYHQPDLANPPCIQDFLLDMVAGVTSWCTIWVSEEANDTAIYPICGLLCRSRWIWDPCLDSVFVTA